MHSVIMYHVVQAQAAELHARPSVMRWPGPRAGPAALGHQGAGTAPEGSRPSRHAACAPRWAAVAHDRTDHRANTPGMLAGPSPARPGR